MAEKVEENIESRTIPENLISCAEFKRKFGMTARQVRNLFDKKILTKYIISEKIIMIDVDEFRNSIKVKSGS